MRWQNALARVRRSPKNPLMPFFTRAGTQVKSPGSGSASSSSCPGWPVRLQPGSIVGSGRHHVSRERGRSDDGVSGRSPDGDAVRATQSAAIAPRATAPAGVDHFLPADRRVALTWPKARKSLHAQPTMRPKAARRAAARTGAVGGCAQHTRPRRPLFDPALPGAQDMNACYAKRRAGAALACKHALAHCSHASAVTDRRFA